MDIDNKPVVDESLLKKRKVEEVENQTMNLDKILKDHIESTQNLARLISVLTQKIIVIEKVFSRDLFKSE